MFPRFPFRKQALPAIALLVLGLTASAARADQVFVANTNIAGTGHVNGQVTFQQSGSNLLQITLQNLQSTSNVGQAISGVQFQIVDAQGNVLNLTGSITAQNNALIQVGSNGSVTSLGTSATGWGLTNTRSTFTLTGLGFRGNGTNPPDELIVGTLNSANGSIAGNGPHNPFIDQSGTFSVTFSSNLPVGFQIRNVVLLFGTGPSSVPGVPTGIPEPATMFLLGTGLVGVATRLRRKRAATYQDKR